MGSDRGIIQISATKERGRIGEFTSMKLVLLLVLICLGIGAAVLTRTLTIPVRKSDYKPEQGNHRAEEYAAKLSKMVKYDTTS